MRLQKEVDSILDQVEAVQKQKEEKKQEKEAKLQKEKKFSFLFIAHDLSMVKHISDRVAVLYLGTLVELTTSEELYAIPIPDPKVEAERDRKKIRLEGEVPSPINTKPGCKFQGRCKYAKDICRQQMPELKDVGNNHFVACHFCDALEENKEL